VRRFAATLIAAAAFAPAAHGGEAIVSLTPYELPPFDSERLTAGHAYTEAEYAGVREGAGYELARLVYRSDGLEVVAHLDRPRHAAGPLPVIVYNRGSWVMDDPVATYAPFYRRLSRAGYLVVAPQYRGSAGAGGRDELGGDDLHDVTNLVPVLAELGTADLDRVFMIGESRGGMMTYRAIQAGMPLRAAAVFGAFTDLEGLLASMRADDPGRTQGMVDAIWPDFGERREEILERRSALRWAEDLTVPLLILHGGDDGDVPVGQSLALAGRLSDLGRKYQLVVYAGDRHALPHHQAERDTAILRWFAEHGGVTGEPAAANGP
jgi:dipeptidyl aminopeptidase/acylaminoacyl peptidase